MAKVTHLKDIIKLQPNMKILIDERVEKDADGSFVVNVGYIRVSTDKQADKGYGLDIQEKSVLNYCQMKNYDNLLLLVDDGYTGTKMDRPGLNTFIRMIEDYNDGRSNVKINSFTIPRIDRLSRSLLGTLQFIQDYIVSQKDSKNSAVNRNREDIDFISIAEQYCRIDKDNPQGKLILMMFASFAEFDRDMITEKMQKGKLERVETGKWLWSGRNPYGYRYNKEIGKLETVPEEAAKIKEVFRLYIEEKLSMQQIADRLGFKSDQVVNQILRRKSLTGCITYKDDEFAGEHEAIISLERWNEAQTEIANRSVAKSTSAYLLSGLVFCADCGARMRYQIWDKNTRECKIVCYSTQKSKKNLIKDPDCQNKHFWQTEIEAAVIDELFRLQYLADASKKKETAFLEPLSVLQQQLNGYKTQLARSYKLFSLAGEDDEVLLKQIAEIQRQIKTTEQQIREEEKNNEVKKKIENACDLLRNLKQTWPHMTPQEQQAVCRELIERITISSSGEVNVHLKLNSYLANKTQ